VVARLTPYSLVFGPIAAERFPVIRDGIRTAGRDPRDRDAFVLVKEVVELLRELGPEDGLGEGVQELVALTHGAYLYWLDGTIGIAVDRSTLDQLVRGPAGSAAVAAGRSYYLQLPPQRVWGEVEAGAAAEPLDGWFAMPGPAGLDVVAVFGLHPSRAGFTVVTAGGARAAKLAREDGTPLFAPRLSGGAEAGLHQIQGVEELLELAYRCHRLLPETGAEPGVERVSLT